MKDDEDDDPAVLSSAIYEQFSHLMKTNEKIQRELATATSTGSSPVTSPRASDTIRGLSKPTKDEESEDIEGLDALNLSSSDLLRHLVESEEDNDSADITPRSTAATVSASDVGLAALKNAELRELRALQFSDKSAVSALQIRRSSTVTSASSPLPSGGAVVGGAVMTGIEELSLVTNQLKKNASYQQHGPGLASCVSLCSRFIAVGTMKGFVLLFDHHQEIRKVLTHPNPNAKPSVSSSSAGISLPALAVVALDSLGDGSMVVAAHRCGDVIFWDCAKGVVLKQLRDPSNADVISLRFLRPVATSDPRHTHSLSDSDTFHVLVLTSSSVINRYKLSKSLLSTWHCDVDCLLDESSGQVVAWAELSPFQVTSEPQSSNNTANGNDVTSPNIAPSLSTPTATTSTSSTSSSLSRFYSDLRQQRGVVQLFAFSFASQTCVVQSSPDVRIVFKWPNANYSLYESKESRECLDWTWLTVPFDLSAPASTSASTSEGMVCAVLTRARETFIDMLVLRVKRTASSQSSVGANVTSADSSRSSGRGGAGGSGRSSSIFMMVGNALTGGSVTSASVEDIPSLSFECLTWLNRSVPNQHDHILAIKWIKASQLIAFTKTEVLLFDAALTVLERCLLLPPISHAFLATIDRQSTVSTEIRPDITVMNNEGYVLTSTACFKLFTKSPFEQANSLINSGRWLEGLSLIVENISKSPSLLTSEAEHIRRYIINYTLLAVKRTGAAGNADNIAASSNKVGGVIGLGRHSRNHYHLVASVCSEYCVSTKQLSLLFQEILDVFRIEGQADVLLESLEPFILNRSIAALPTNILLAFFQMGVALNKLQQVERCLIALNPRTLFPCYRLTDNTEETSEADDVIARLFQHRLFSAFLYYYSIGKDDHVSAFQAMFQFLLLHYDVSSGAGRSSEEVGQGSGELSRVALTSFEEEEERRELFYKLFLFLADVFEGKIFPTSEPVTTFFSTCDASDEISYPFDTSSQPTTSAQGVEDSATEVALRGAKVVHGLQVNAMWSLLNLLTTDQLPPFLSFAAGTLISRERYEQHPLHHLEFPLLYFFSRFDYITLFQVLLKGFEHVIALFTSSKDGGEPHFSSHHHLIIGGGGGGSGRWEAVALSKDVIPLSARQKNETKIIALLQNLFLFVKEEKERADVASDDGTDSSAASDDRQRIFLHFFQNFPPLLLRLSNAVVAPDFLHALIAYHASARLAPPRSAQSTALPFSAKKSEELLRALIETQLKLLLTSSSGGGGGGGSGSKKFTIFSEKLVTSLSEADFHWTAFLVRKYYVKLFPTSSSTENDYTRQFRSYLHVIKQRRELGKSLKPTHSHLFQTLGISSPTFSKTPVAPINKKTGVDEEGESEDVQEVLFAFILEGLEYFEREKNSADVSSSFSSAWPSVQAVEQQLAKFREAVLEVVVELLELSVERTIDRIVLPYFISTSALRALTDASKRHAALQFRALHYLITQLRHYHDQNNTTFHIKHYFMNPELLYFLRLHCMFSPDHLLSFLKHYIFSSSPAPSTALPASSSSRASEVVLVNTTLPSEEDLPLDEMAGILKEFPQISDGIAFFEEMFGRVDEALTILLRDFSLKLKGVRKEIDGALRAESANTSRSLQPATTSSSTSVAQLLLQVRALLSSSRSQWHKSLGTPSSATPSSSTQSHLQQLLGDMTSQLASCRALRYSLSCISELCERQLPSAFAGIGVNATSDSPLDSSLFQRELAEKMWCRAFDHLLNERRKTHSLPSPPRSLSYHIS